MAGTGIPERSGGGPEAGLFLAEHFPSAERGTEFWLNSAQRHAEEPMEEIPRWVLTQSVLGQSSLHSVEAPNRMDIL